MTDGSPIAAFFIPPPSACQRVRAWPDALDDVTLHSTLCCPLWSMAVPAQRHVLL